MFNVLYAEKYAIFNVIVKNWGRNKCLWRHIRSSNDVTSAIGTSKDMHLKTKVDVSKDFSENILYFQWLSSATFFSEWYDLRIPAKFCRGNISYWNDVQAFQITFKFLFFRSLIRLAYQRNPIKSSHKQPRLWL